MLPETVIPEYLFDSAVEAASAYQIFLRASYPFGANEFLFFSELPDLDARLSEIRQLVHRLPRAHYTVLKRFAEHLDK